jgi:hypothetical protein
MLRPTLLVLFRLLLAKGGDSQRRTGQPAQQFGNLCQPLLDVGLDQAGRQRGVCLTVPPPCMDLDGADLRMPTGLGDLPPGVGNRNLLVGLRRRRCELPVGKPFERLVTSLGQPGQPILPVALGEAKVPPDDQIRLRVLGILPESCLCLLEFFVVLACVG